MEFVKYSKDLKIKDGDHVFHHTSNSYPLIKDMDVSRYYYVREDINGSLVFVRMSDGKTDPTINVSSFDDTWWIMPTSAFLKTGRYLIYNVPPEQKEYVMKSFFQSPILGKFLKNDDFMSWWEALLETISGSNTYRYSCNNTDRPEIMDEYSAHCPDLVKKQLYIILEDVKIKGFTEVYSNVSNIISVMEKYDY